MNKRREKRKRARQYQYEHIRLKNKRRLEHVLLALGFLSGYRALPAWAREQLAPVVPGRPKVTISSDATFYHHQSNSDPSRGPQKH